MLLSNLLHSAQLAARVWMLLCCAIFAVHRATSERSGELFLVPRAITRCRPTMYYNHGFQVSKRMRVTLEYATAILSALGSSYLILRLGL